MKKILSFLLAVVMTLSLCACGDSKTNQTEQEVPELEQIAVLDKVSITWMGKTKEYTSGSNMAIDEFGQLSELNKTSNDYSFEYNDIGQIMKVNHLNDDPNKVGYETVTYQDGMPVSNEYNPNDGFRSLRNTSITTETNESGQITVMTENNSYTDVEDGSKSSDITKYEYEYNQEGKIISIKYYKDNKMDHTTEISYDENGNVTEYTNIGASNNSKYLTVKFTYKMVDANSITIKEKDAFTIVNNIEMIVNTIL